MKWVVITLLLLNGLYLAVQLSQKGTDQGIATSKTNLPLNTPELVLQVEKEKLDQAKQFAEKQKQQKLAQAETKRPSSSASRPKAVVAKPEEPRPASKPIEQPVVTVPSTPVVSPPKSPAPTSNAMACYSVGPFLLMSDIKGVSQLFELASINTQERAEALRKQVGWWVYVPPLASLQAARVALRQMKNNSVDDALIISEGSKANAISLGVYKTEELGLERKKELGKLGYQSRVEPLFRTQPQYWLDLELIKSTKVPDKLWREVIAGYPNIKQLRRKCE